MIASTLAGDSFASVGALPVRSRRSTRVNAAVAEDKRDDPRTETDYQRDEIGCCEVNPESIDCHRIGPRLTSMAALIEAQYGERQCHGNERANARHNGDEERAESSPLHTVSVAISGQFVESGRRDLNPRHLAWEASSGLGVNGE